MKKIVEGLVIDGCSTNYLEPSIDIKQQDKDHKFYPYHWFPGDFSDYLKDFIGKKIRITIEIEELK